MRPEPEEHWRLEVRSSSEREPLRVWGGPVGAQRLLSGYGGGGGLSRRRRVVVPLRELGEEGGAPARRGGDARLARAGEADDAIGALA